MGFIPGSTIQIEAYLTKKGASDLMENGIKNIKYFAVSDDASNYATNQKLGFNQVYSLAGKTFVDNKFLTVLNDMTLSSRIFVDSGSETYKSFESDSGVIMTEENVGDINNVGFYSIYPTYTSPLTNNYVLNWVKDLNLRYGTSDDTIWSLPFNSGGFSNTSLQYMDPNQYSFYSIDSSQYAFIDGKTIKFTVPISVSGTTDLYGSYLNTNQPNTYYDSQYSDNSTFLRRFGPNTVLLFSDLVSKPNGDATKSWSTGYGVNAPYSQGGKHLANFITGGGRNRDIAVGMAFLDKGVIVTFYPGLTGSFNNSLLELNNKNVVRRTVASFVCDLPLGKFYRSQNSTFYPNAPVRITSIGLFNENKELMAIGRLNSQVEKSSGQRFTFLVKLVI